MSDIELELLEGMRASELVTAACVRLGRPLPALAASAWPSGARQARTLEDFRRSLGEEIEVGPDSEIAPASPYRGSQRYRFATTVWPGFDLRVGRHPNGSMWGAELVRSRGSVAPTAATPAELEPWTILDSEVQARFGPHAEEEAWEHGVDARRRDAGRWLTMWFDYGLLQAVRS